MVIWSQYLGFHWQQMNQNHSRSQGPLPPLLLTAPCPQIKTVFSSQDIFYIACLYMRILASLLFHRWVMSDSLWPHGLQHARLTSPSLSPRACSNSCPLSQWCRPIISFSIVPISSCLQSFPASGSFPMSQLFTSGGENTGISALVLPIVFSVDIL